MLDELIRKSRSYRRFYQEVAVDMAILRELVDLARLGGSARNVQPLKYMLVNTTEGCAEVFPHLAWAGYLKDWPGPVAGERPAAYIICLLDTRLSREADCDLGIATQNILLGATARGLGGCRIASISPGIRATLALPEHLQVLMALALGKARETVVLKETGPDGDIRYWRDAAQVHYVPKRSLAELIIG